MSETVSTTKTPEAFGSLAWDMKLIAMIGDAATTYKHTDEFAPYWSHILRLLDFVRTTAAADLVPREEHERAVKDAAPAKLDANTAVKYLVSEYDLDTGHMDTARPRTHPFDHNGHVYEVVVRRKGKAAVPVDSYDANGNYTGSAEPVDQATANRLVEWYAANNREHKMTWSHEVNGRTYFVCVAPHDGTGYAPDPQAVAPVGVVDEIRNEINVLRAAGGVGDRAVADRLEAALSRITELPPPSEWAREHGANGYTQSRRRDLAAALLESDGDHD